MASKLRLKEKPVTTLDIQAKAPVSQPRAGGADTNPAAKRRSQRVVIDIPVTIFGKSADGKIFTENTKTVTVNAHGALVTLNFEIDTQKSALLLHAKTGTQVQCRVAYRKETKKGCFDVGLEFAAPNPKLWGITFPPEDWNPADRKKAPPSANNVAASSKGVKK